jgi:hypothetical protein
MQCNKNIENLILKILQMSLDYDSVEGRFYSLSNLLREFVAMEMKLILVGLTVVFTISCLFFGTKNGFYDSDDYHGNGSAH